MKVNKMVSVDDWLYERLKDSDNASELICRLLVAHFNTEDGKPSVTYKKVVFGE